MTLRAPFRAERRRTVHAVKGDSDLQRHGKPRSRENRKKGGICQTASTSGTFEKRSRRRTSPRESLGRYRQIAGYRRASAKTAQGTDQSSVKSKQPPYPYLPIRALLVK